jgi:hypothetical protein
MSFSGKSDVFRWKGINIDMCILVQYIIENFKCSFNKLNAPDAFIFIIKKDLLKI